MNRQFHGHEIAVIGMTGRFPDANDLNEFWDNLKNGKDCIRREPAGKNQNNAGGHRLAYVDARGTLEGVDLFDAAFFGLTPREAERTDPQHRVFLECAWEALEVAGYDARTYPGWIGVFAACSTSTYLFRVLSSADASDGLGLDQIRLANDKDFLATRVSYAMDLKGPSLSVSTACSSSLVAVHYACRSLLGYECDIALAGGVSIHDPAVKGYQYNLGGTLSPDGKVRTFDANAQGTVPGEGVGLVVLKRLQEAIDDGDCIDAIILGSAINNDGSRKAGFTAPSIEGQAQVIALSQSVAGISPEDVSYVEAHGTGTPLGDPIELKALLRAFGEMPNRLNSCALGSVKTNIGHLDAAAGIAGLIKTVLSLNYRYIPPSLNFERPNLEFDFSQGPFYVNSELREWVATDVRTAGISAFAIGGTNAHVIVQEAPEIPTAAPSRAYQLLVLSAKTPEALRQRCSQLQKHLQNSADSNLPDTCFTLQVGRQAFRSRRAIVAKDRLAVLEQLGRSDYLDQLRVDDDHFKRLAFVFSSIAEPNCETGQSLYRSEPVFEQHMDQCMDLLTELRVHAARCAYFPSQKLLKPVDDGFLILPFAFSVQYSLAKLWMHWGVNPNFVTGTGTGEYLAACLSGVLSLQEALLLVCAQEDLVRRLTHGRFISSAFDAFRLASAPQAADELRALVGGFKLGRAEIPFLSTVTGELISKGNLINDSNWAQTLCWPAGLPEALNVLKREPCHVFLLLGDPKAIPPSFLSPPSQKAPEIVPSVIWQQEKSKPDEQVLLESLAALWMRGIKIDWKNFYSAERRRRIHLPTYPFERQRYWLEASEVMGRIKARDIGETNHQSKTSLHPIPHRPDYVGPRNNIEKTIAEIWQLLLGVDQIGTEDNFFDLGGDSLTAARCVARIREALNVEIGLEVLFDAPTLTALAKEVIRTELQRLDKNTLASLVSEVGKTSAQSNERLETVGNRGKDAMQ